MCSSRLVTTLLVISAPVFGQSGIPLIAGVSNYFNFRSNLGIAPGSVVDVTVTNINLGAPTIGGAPGLAVSVNGVPCVIQFSQGNTVQTGPTTNTIILTVPFEAPLSGSSMVAQYQTVKSAAFPLQLAAYAPAIQTDINGLATTTVVAPGGSATITVSGLGQTNPAIPSGQSVPANTIPLVQPQVLVGGLAATNVSAARLTGIQPAYGDFFLNLTVPRTLTPGTYSIVVSTGGFSSNSGLIRIPIPGLVLSQSGFTFQSVQNGGAPAPQVLNLLSGNSGSYSITISTISGGPGWLSATPSSGSLNSASGVPVTILVNPAGLSPGDYYALLRIDAPNAPNTPQLATVVLNVNTATADPGPTVLPSGLAFVAVQGATFLAEQSVQINVVGTGTESFTTTIVSNAVINPFTISPTTGTAGPGKPVSLSVQANPSGLGNGVYRGTLNVTFPRTGLTRSVDLLLVVTTALNPLKPILTEVSPPATNACSPTQVLLVSTTVPSNFTISTAWPTPLEVYAVDDCGTPLHSGTINATFSNSDPVVAMQPLIDGRWTGTWASRDSSNPNVQITFAAQSDAGLRGNLIVSGSLQPNKQVPILNPGGVVSSASFNGTAAPSLGEIVAIFGTNLGGGVGVAPGIPLPTAIQSVQLSLAGKGIPLIFVSEGQVNAVLPYNLNTGASYPLVAQRDNRLSVPVSVTIAPANPAIFTTDLSGKGQGHIYVTPTATTQILASRENPAKAGDLLILYCTGLGPTNPASTAGQPTPFDSLRPTASAVTLSIGGVPATVLFSGLTPGFSGLYQVNAYMPSGVAAGDAAVLLTEGGISSRPVTMAVQ
jgi:uncharacterized protein (TIGR03437 family)